MLFLLIEKILFFQDAKSVNQTDPIFSGGLKCSSNAYFFSRSKICLFIGHTSHFPGSPAYFSLNPLTANVHYSGHCVMSSNLPLATIMAIAKSHPICHMAIIMAIMFIFLCFVFLKFSLFFFFFCQFPSFFSLSLLLQFYLVLYIILLFYYKLKENI